MSNPISALLERLARELFCEYCAEFGMPVPSLITDGVMVHPDTRVGRVICRAWKRKEEVEQGRFVLREKLGPLLQAGQAMRENIGAYAVALNAIPFQQADTSRAIRGCIDGLHAWEAALKGSPRQNG